MHSGPRLTRSADRWLAGVCGGIAHFVGWTPASVRAAFVFLTVVSVGFPGVAAYLILAWLMPPPPTRGRFDLDDFRRQ